MKKEKAVILIQKIVRGFLIRKKILLVPSNLQTKKWRMNQKWYKGGKHNECEKYQKNIIEKIIKLKLEKTFERINIEKNIIKEKRHPLKYLDGYEWTEDFDGKLIKNKKTYYFNLKFVSDNGGAQTRTLREVYHFIKNQIKFLEKNKKEIYFINILDGDTSYLHLDKFKYLLEKKKNIKYKKRIFIGDLYSFQNSINKVSL